jgi:arylsulfatase A-like enzyme
LATGEFAGSTPTPYGDFVRQVDADFGRILAELDRLGLARNTLVVFTTDNGYAPAGDIPSHRALGHDSSGGFRGAKSDSYEGGHRVPFLVRWPGVTPPGGRSGAVIGHLDLFATLAEVLGVPLPVDVAEDSSSFLPLLRGSPLAPGGREGLVHHSSEGEFSIRAGRWKLILAPGSGGWGRPTRSPSPWTQPKPDSFEGLPAFQLYDLEADPRETTNLEARHPEVVARLGRLLRGYIERGRSTPGPAQPYVREGWPQVAWMERFAP